MNSGENISPVVAKVDHMDLLGAFLAEFRRFPVLDDIEEVGVLSVVSKRNAALKEFIKRGGRVHWENEKFKVVSPRENVGRDKRTRVRHLAALIREAEPVRQELIVRNLRLVLTYAKPYFYKREDKEDVVQAGNEGLIQAVDSWFLGDKFSWFTHATRAIRFSILDQMGRGYRGISDSDFLDLSKIRESRRILRNGLGRRPTMHELMEQSALRGVKVKTKINKERFWDLASYDNNTMEIDYHYLADDWMKPERVEGLDSENDLWRRIEDWINNAGLTHNENVVVDLLFGRQGDERNLTYEGVGEELGGWSKQRAFDNATRALRKLRNCAPDWINEFVFP